MSFKDVIIKNFKYKIKSYSAFYSCSTFTITMFFIFTTLFFNNNIQTFLKDAGSGADIVLYIALVATFIFAVFFISYIQTSMKKSRSKEFGLLMILGMTAKDLGKIIIIEDLVLSASSIISGILTGMLFSRLVHMFINRLMELQVPYSLSYKSFILTLCAFVVIFTFVALWEWIKTRKLEISKLLKEQRRTEYSGDGSAAVLALGVLMVLSLAFYAVIAIKNRDYALNLKLTFSIEILGLLGVYLIIANLFPKLLCFIKKRKSFYNKNMIMLAEVKYSIGKNKKLIYVAAILSAVIIYSFSSSLGLFSIIENIVDSSNSSDIEYIEAFNINNFKQQELTKAFDEEKLTLRSRQDIKCLFLNTNGIKLDYQLPLIAISNSAFNELSSKVTDVPKGSMKFCGDIMNLPDANGNSVNVQAGTDNLKFTLLKPESLSVLSIGSYLQYKFILILNDQDYNQLEKVLPQPMLGTIHKYRFNNDWRSTKYILSKVSELSKESKNITGKTGIENALNVSGRYYEYDTMKKLYSIFIFIFMFLTLLFYAASILMLFLRQFESLERARRKYMQLRKIGITAHEFGKGILQEMRIIFLTPVVFGIILGYSFMLITESMVGGSSMADVFMKNAVIMTVAYILLQIIACELSGRKFLNSVTEKNNR